MSRKRSIFLILTLVLALSGNYTSTTAQTATDTDAVQQLATDTQNGAKIWQSDTNSPVKFITIPPQNAVPKPRSLAANASDEQVARAFLGTYGQIVGVRSQQTELTLLKQERTANADGFVRFQQVYRTIPVMGGELNVHVNQQRNVTSVNGEILPNITLNTTPSIDSDNASTIARNYIAKQYGIAADTLSVAKSTLWIYNPQLLGGPGTQITTLNWRTEVRGQRGADPIRELVLVNANNGIVTLHFNQIAYALNQRVCNSNNVMDTDYDSNNNCNTDAKAARLNSNTPSSNADVNIAWEYTKATYDYFFQVLGRDSIDNKGMRLISLVNYCPKGEVCPFENAYWNGVQMTYGPGFASADDVVAHELTHGITERTASLFYYFQSGAINESMSDVFGELIDQSYLGNSTDNSSVKWLMGEDLTIGAIRSMSTPADFQQPDKMTDTDYYVNFTTPDYASYGGYNDSGGVHTNSGVNNKAAYLMVDGDTFNGQTITGIGSTKVAQLYYRVLTTYLTSGSDYYDLGVALNTACSDLVTLGIASMSSADCTQVAYAVTATEMLTTPTNAPATDAVLCSAGQTPVTVWADNFEIATSGNWAAQKPKVVWYNPGSLDIYGNGKYATSGVGNLWGYNLGSTTDSSINMVKNLTIPAGAFLTFKHSFEFESSNYISTTAEFYDGGVLEYSINNSTTWTDAGSLITTNGYNGTVTATGTAPGVSSTNILKTRQAFVSASSGYISSKVDLSTLAGSPVRFRFRIGTDSAGDNYGWYIDDVRLYKCLDDTTTAKTTAVGGDHSCTITNDGNAWCWGRNRFGQLGDNSVSAKSTRASLVTKPSLTGFTSIATSNSHTCARASDGSAWCWGDNSSGQLGDGTTTDSSGAVQVTTDSSGTFLTNVSAISVGTNASCALKSNGTVWCWGDNGEGQLGDRTSDSSSFAVQVEKASKTTLSTVTAISVGTDHACAVLSDKSAWCWGDNSDGATGAGTAVAREGAVRVTKAANAVFTNVVAISAGNAHTCALLGDKTVWCWGLNAYGQLGNGSTTTSLVAVSAGLTNIAILGQNTGNHTCAVSATNILSCWGANTAGQLGDGTIAAKTRAVALKTTYAATTGTITGVSSGGKQTCLSNTMGEVWCWGRNSNGQLGNDSTLSSLAPVKVRNTSDVMFGN
jgi:bacillolysin